MSFFISAQMGFPVSPPFGYAPGMQRDMVAGTVPGLAPRAPAEETEPQAARNNADGNQNLRMNAQVSD